MSIGRKYRIEIHDAKNGGYRARTMAPNQEKGQWGETLESVAAMNKHLKFGLRCWTSKGIGWAIDPKKNNPYELAYIVDHTKKSAFVRYGAIPHSEKKPAKK